MSRSDHPLRAGPDDVVTRDRGVTSEDLERLINETVSEEGWLHPERLPAGARVEVRDD